MQEPLLIRIFSTIMILPANLTSIESEAFVGISAKSVYIPATVENIALNAFPEGTIIYDDPKSYAHTWADDNGFQYVEYQID